MIARKRLIRVVSIIVLVIILVGAAVKFSLRNSLEPYATTEEGFFLSGDIQIRYAFDVPKTSGPFPVVVIGHGSGKSTAASRIRFSRKLVKHGIAVFRHDKRGVGKSEGVHSKAWSDLHLYAEDLAAAVSFIKDRPEVDPSRIGLMGTSQSGWVIPMATELSQDVRFIILLSGPTVTTAEANFFNSTASDASLSMEDLSKRLKTFEKPVGDIDPLPYLEQFDGPGLWLYGAEDRVVPAAESAAILENLVQGSQKPFTVKIYKDGDHKLRHAETGDPIDYWPDVLNWFDTTVK